MPKNIVPMTSEGVEIIVVSGVTVLALVLAFVFPFVNNDPSKKYSTISAALIEMRNKWLFGVALALFTTGFLRIIEIADYLDKDYFIWIFSILCFFDGFILLLLAFVYDLNRFPKIHYFLFLLVVLISFGIMATVTLGYLHKDRWKFDSISIIFTVLSSVMLLLFFLTVIFINLPVHNIEQLRNSSIITPVAEFFFIVMFLAFILTITYDYFRIH